MLGISRATLYRKLKRYSIPMRGDSNAIAEIEEEEKSHAASR
jgi:hypothetical protein